MDRKTVVASACVAGLQSYIDAGGRASNGAAVFSAGYIEAYVIDADIRAAISYPMIQIVPNMIQIVPNAGEDVRRETRVLPVRICPGTLTFDENRIP